MLKSIRLNGALELIDPALNYADIGADHGYLAMAMKDAGVKVVQVVENKVGPLGHAKENLQDYDDVIFTLADGLTTLDSKIEAVTILGMGGLNIVGIIDHSLEVAKSLKQLILQPNSKIHELRQFLSEQHFKITDEKIVYEQGKYYEIIACVYDELSLPLTEEEIYFGPVLIRRKSTLFVNKYEKIRKQLESRLPLLGEEHAKQKEDVLQELALIKQLEI